MKIKSPKTRRLLLLFAGLVTAIALVAWLGPRPHRQLSAAPEPAWMQHPAQEDPAWRNRFGSGRGISYLNSLAPSFDKVNFGPGTRSQYWRAAWVVTEIFTAVNGAQYAIVSTSNHGQEGTLYDLGILSNGNLLKIPVPDAGMNAVLQFMSRSALNTPVVQLTALGRPNGYYAVRGTTAYPTSGVSGGYRGDPPAEACQDVRATGSPYAFLLRGVPVVTKAELSAASLGVAQSPEAYVKCYRFGANTVVEVGSSIGVAVTYRVLAGRMTLLSRGGAEFISTRYLLFRITEPALTTFAGPGGTEYQDYMQDYLEVFAQ